MWVILISVVLALQNMRSFNKMMEIENNARALYSVFGECLPCNVSEGKVFF